MVKIAGYISIRYFNRLFEIQYSGFGENSDTEPSFDHNKNNRSTS